MKKKKVDKLVSLYAVVAVFVAVLSVFSFTFAWYVKTSTQYLNITFAPPIVVNITNTASVITPIEGSADAVLPGSKVKINLGVQMDNNSSNAYMRAKMSLIFDDVYDENNQLLIWDNYVDISNAIELSDWVEVNFSTDPLVEDIWYVCKTGYGTGMISHEVTAGEIIPFANGTIDIKLNINNYFAEKQIKIVFVVETVQTVGVSDPLANGVQNAKYHEIWGS